MANKIFTEKPWNAQHKTSPCPSDYWG